jgi:hypothetical protein
MNKRSALSTVPTGTVIHRGFIPYVSIDQEGVKGFLKAIAVNPVGQAITLAVLGIKATAMIMQNMSIEPRCRLALPNRVWVSEPLSQPGVRAIQHVSTAHIRL